MRQEDCQYLEGAQAATLASLYHAERKNQPTGGYIAGRLDILPNNMSINASMRSIVVDWLFEVTSSFALSAKTNFLAIAYLDRYLSISILPRQDLQLLASTCLAIASKYEEKSPPMMQEIAYLGCCDVDAMKEMEIFVLNGLRFQLMLVTPVDFLRQFCRVHACVATPMTQQLSMYMLELFTVDYECVGYVPSLLAAVAMRIALYSVEELDFVKLGEDEWQFSFTKGEISRATHHLAQQVLDFHEVDSYAVDSMSATYRQYPSIYEKFASTKLLCVSRHFAISTTWKDRARRLVILTHPIHDDIYH